MKEKEDPRMVKLAELLKKESDAAVEVGKIILEMVKDDPANHDRIREKFSLSEKAMDRYQKLALGRIHPVLALSTAPAAGFIESLPRAIQDKVINEGVTVVRKAKGGKIESEKVSFKRLSYKDARLALGKDGERPIEEQAERLNILPIGAKSSWEIFGDVVVFRNARYKISQLDGVVDQIKQEYSSKIENKDNKAA